MSDLIYEIQALEKSTHSRLLSINEKIRELRKFQSVLYKAELQFLSTKRKETDLLLSQIKNLKKDDRDSFNKLKQTYLSFQI